MVFLRGNRGSTVSVQVMFPSLLLRTSERRIMVKTIHPTEYEKYESDQTDFDLCVDGASVKDLITNEAASSSLQTPSKGVHILSAPYVGMIFDSIDHAKEYYTEYGRQNGFLTRIRSKQRKIRGDGEPNNCLLVCGREGHHTKKNRQNDGSSANQVIQRNTSTIKCGCKARMRIVLTHDGTWRVSIFSDAHSHKMVTPCKRKRMKTNRNFPTSAKALSEAFHEENLPVGKVASVLDGNAIGFNKRDCWNHLGSLRTTKTKYGDATAALSFFQKKTTEDPQFFYAIQTDDEGRAVNFFWADGRSRLQYKHFGDVVVFDTTYKTNVYQMPFGPFTGVNHHWQSIQFGCALLLDESEESFLWLFQTWLGAMGGEAPISIITDQDQAMNLAIAKAFPNSRHRLCIWRIMKKLPEHAAYVYSQNPSFKKEIHDCIWNTCTENDFEEKWSEIMRKNNLEDNDWLRQMYEIRHKWVPAYNYNTFYAGMNTTGRSEGMNSFYKDYFRPSTTLTEFLHKNEKCLDKIANDERDEDYETEHKSRVLREVGPLIKHASLLYTRNIFDKFLSEWNKAQSNYRVVEKSGDENKTYIIRSRNGVEEKDREVCFSLETLEGCCECKLYEFMGIPCRHILKLFIRFDIDEIPKSFILRRWTQGANKYRIKDSGELLRSAKDSTVSRLCHGSMLASQVVYECAEDNETFRLLVDTLTTLSENVAKIKASKKSNVALDAPSNISVEEPLVEISQVLLNPNVSQTKGRKKISKNSGSSRIKSSIEIEQNRKKRTCKLCKVQAGHDKRNCPNNPKRKGKDSIIQNEEKMKDSADKDFKDDELYMDDGYDDDTENL